MSLPVLGAALMMICAGCGATTPLVTDERLRVEPVEVRDGGSAAFGETDEASVEDAGPEAFIEEYVDEFYEPSRVEKPRPVVEPEIHPECVIEDEGADILPFLGRYKEKLCTWLAPEERARLTRIDLSRTAGGDAEELALMVRDEALRKLAPLALRRSRERMLKMFARRLNAANKGNAANGAPMLGACYGAPLYEACEGDCGWQEGQPCKRCRIAARQFEPLRLLCGPLSEENLIWEGTPSMGEGEIPASGRAHFTSVFTASLDAKVPRRQVVRFAVGLLEKLVVVAKGN